MLREFIKSSSGLAPIRQGLGLGSVISILSGVAVLFGAKEAAASEWCEECYYDTWVRGKRVTLRGYKSCSSTTTSELVTNSYGSKEIISTTTVSCSSCGSGGPPCP